MIRLLMMALVASVAFGGCREIPDGPPRVGEAAPVFEAPLRLSGEVSSFAALKGSPALINLWATWCPPCRSETPYLQLLADELGEYGLQVLGVSVDNASARGAVDDFLASVGASYPQMLDPRMESMDLFGVLGLPATFLIDADGVITYYDFGPVDDGDPAFSAALRAVLPDGVSIPDPSVLEGEG